MGKSLSQYRLFISKCAIHPKKGGVHTITPKMIDFLKNVLYYCKKNYNFDLLVVLA